MSNKVTTGAKALVQALVDHGADRAFGVPGESYLSVLDALVDVEDKLPFVTCRHEAAAANMAEAYGKLTGRAGICFVTRGPGATHASIGLHTAYQDSTPMILFIGQVARDQLEREAFQEIDYRRMFGQMAKWVAEIHDPNRIAEYVGRAFATATSGRPGPVVLALPEDMLREACAIQASHAHKRIEAWPGPHDFSELLERLAKAERPLVMLGGSGWTKQAVADIRHFCEINRLPVTVSFRCQDRYDNRLDTYVGDVAIGANPKLVKRLADADLLLVLGPRLGEMTTGGYERITVPVPKQSLIHIHQGAEELGRVYQGDLLINSSPAAVTALLRDVDLEQSDRWSAWTKAARADYLAWTTPVSNPGAVQVAEIYTHLNETLSDDAILCNGAGNYAAWLHRFYRYKSFPSQLAPTSGAMGYGVPAAIAAKIHAPEREVVCFSGDGCFMMSSNDLATAVRYDAAVIFLVFNNSMYGTIRMHQERDYPTRVSGTGLTNPDFVAFAKSFGCAAFKVDKTEDFAGAFASARAAGKPVLIEITIDEDAISPTTTVSKLRGE